MADLSSNADSAQLGLLKRLIGAKVARDTAWTLVTELAGMASQLCTLVLIGRAFSREVYGIFAGTVAFMNVISPVTTIGMGYVLVQRVAGERGDPDTELGRAWTMVILGGLLGIVVAVGSSSLIVPGVPLRVLVALGLGELVFSQITYVGQFCSQALDRPADGARVVATVWLMRLLIAAVYLAIVPEPTLAGWATLHMSASLAGAVLTYIATTRMFALQPRASLANRLHIRRGLSFSLSIGAIYLKNDADKTLLLTFNKPDAAGLYGLAYRVTIPLLAPIRALAGSTFSRFFRDASQSPRAAYDLALRTTLAGFAFTVTGGAAIAAGAPLLPHLLGEKWEPAVIVVQLLAFVPMLVALQMYAFNALMGLGRQRVCVIVSICASVLNIGLNIALIPHYDWKGSTAATVVAEVFSVVTLWTVLRSEVRKHEPTHQHHRDS